jgi:hypothetical protein
LPGFWFLWTHFQCGWPGWGISASWSMGLRYNVLHSTRHLCVSP